MLDRAIICIFGLVLIMGLIISVFGVIFTMIQEIQFDAICRNHLVQIDLDGGMKQEVADEIRQELLMLGYSDIEIEGSESVQYGEKIDFKVSGKKKKLISGALYEMFETSRYSYYESQVISRKIHNNAF